MKLVVDLFPCQTESRYRGIGRYSHSLIRAMARLRGAHDMVVFANAMLQESFEELRQEFLRDLPYGSFKPYYQGIPGGYVSCAPEDTKIAETLVRQSYQAVGSDVILSPSIFEGLGGVGVVPLPDRYHLGSRVGILYDIIPYLFQTEYLDHSPETKTWYLDRLNKIHTYDLLLAISEASRQDVIDRLGVSPDKVVNISGAASSNFRKISLTAAEKLRILGKYGITRPFVLYIGGNNPRKNMMGMVMAYAQLPRDLLDHHQLVINEVEHEAIFYSKIQSIGLKKDDVVITGRITEDDLVALYNTCKVFVFPSLYEGFGLPILEAMSCGAAVIAGNNSSLPEVVGRPDTLFNASDSFAISNLLQEVLINDGLLRDLQVYSLKRAQEFSWEKSAQISWNALEALQEKNSASKFFSQKAREDAPKPMIAFVSPLPPQQSGIAFYSSELLPYLAQYFVIDLFVEPGFELSDPNLKDRFRCYPWTELLDRRDLYQTVVYQVGNSEFHSHMVDLIQKFPGVVVEHDFFLSNIPFIAEFIQKQQGEFFKEIDHSHGLRGIVEYRKNGVDQARKDWPLNWTIMKHARQMIVHSIHFLSLLDRYFPSGWKPTPSVIKQLRAAEPEISPAEKAQIREKLKLDPQALIICSFGMISSTKLNYETIQALGKASPGIDPNFRLVFVGEFHEESDYGKSIKKLITDLNLEEKVMITGFIDTSTYMQYLKIADIAIQLRSDSRGETSRAVLDCLANGLPTIINAHGTFNDYDSVTLVKLPEIVDIDFLAEAIVRLSTQPALRAELAKKARQEIYEHHHPEQIAKEYATVIQKTIEGDERRLFAPLTEALAVTEAKEFLLKNLATWAAKNFNLRVQVRILMELTAFESMEADVQETIKDWITGWFQPIDRLARLELVTVDRQRFLRAPRIAEKLFDLPQGSLGEDFVMNPQVNDILVITDPSCSIDEALIQSIKQEGGKVVMFVFDHLTERQGQKERPPFSATQTKSLFDFISQCDLVACASQEVEDEVAHRIGEKGQKRQSLLDLAIFPAIPTGSAEEKTNGETALRLQDLLMGKQATKRVM